MTRGETIKKWLDYLAAEMEQAGPWIRAFEVGRIRLVDETKGHSTLHIVTHHAVERLTTLDIAPKTRQPTLAVVPDRFHGKLEFVDADAVEWLSGAVAEDGHKFDFMYLDGLNNAEHCLAVLELCIGLSESWTVIVIDDTDTRYAKKGVLVVPYIEEHAELFEVLERVPADRNGATCQGMFVVRCRGSLGEEA